MHAPAAADCQACRLPRLLQRCLQPWRKQARVALLVPLGTCTAPSSLRLCHRRRAAGRRFSCGQPGHRKRAGLPERGGQRIIHGKRTVGSLQRVSHRQGAPPCPAPGRCTGTWRCSVPGLTGAVCRPLPLQGLPLRLHQQLPWLQRPGEVRRPPALQQTAAHCLRTLSCISMHKVTAAREAGLANASALATAAARAARAASAASSAALNAGDVATAVRPTLRAWQVPCAAACALGRRSEQRSAPSGGCRCLSLSVLQQPGLHPRRQRHCAGHRSHQSGQQQCQGAAVQADACRQHMDCTAWG